VVAADPGAALSRVSAAPFADDRRRAREWLAKQPLPESARKQLVALAMIDALNVR